MQASAQPNKRSNPLYWVLGLIAAGLLALLWFVKKSGEFAVVKVFWDRGKAVVRTPWGLQYVDITKQEIIKADTKYVLQLVSSLTDPNTGAPISTFLRLINKDTRKAAEYVFRFSSQKYERETYLVAENDPAVISSNFS